MTEKKERKKRDSLWTTDKNLAMFIGQARKANEVEVKWSQVLEDGEIVKLALPDVRLTDQRILEEFLVAFSGVKVKVMTADSVALMKVVKELVAGSKKSSLVEQLEWMPLFFVTAKWKRIDRVLEYLKETKKEQELLCWSLWKELFLYRKSKIRSEGSNLYEKIGDFYAVFFSNSWGIYSKCQFIVKKNDFGALGKIFLAELGLSFNEEAGSLSKLTEEFFGCYKKLAFFKVIYHYLNSNLLEDVKETCLFVKSKCSRELKEIAEGILMKNLGKQRKILEVSNVSNVLEAYHFARAAIKYDLLVPLNKIKHGFCVIETVLSSFTFFDNMFDVKFWEFIMYRNIFMQKKAVEVAKQALGFKISSEFKLRALKKYLGEVESDETMLGLEDFYINNFRDEYLNDICKAICDIRKGNTDLERFHKVLSCPFRYEGVLLNWVRVYRLNKVRETVYKINEDVRERKEDGFHPLFYYKIFKNYLEMMKKVQNFYLSVSLNKIFDSLGKGYFGLNIFDSFCIVQAKSYSRCNLRKSVSKLRKNCEKQVHPLVKYFLLKFEVELVRLTKKPLNKRHNSLLQIYSEISDMGLNLKYKSKLTYILSEFFFNVGQFEKSLDYYLKSNIQEHSKRPKKLNINPSFISQHLNLAKKM